MARITTFLSLICILLMPGCKSEEEIRAEAASTLLSAIKNQQTLLLDAQRDGDYERMLVILHEADAIIADFDDAYFDGDACSRGIVGTRCDVGRLGAWNGNIVIFPDDVALPNFSQAVAFHNDMLRILAEQAETISRSTSSPSDLLPPSR